MFDTAMPRRRRSGLWIGVIAAAAIVAMVVTYLVTKGSATTPLPVANSSTSPGAATSGAATSGSPTSTSSSAPALPNITAPADGAVINKAALASVAVALDGQAAQGAVISVDGTAVQPTTSSTGVSWKPATPLADGKHTLLITGAGLDGGKLERTFTIDSTGPKLVVAAPKPLATGSTGVTVTGTTDPGQTVTAGGQTAQAAADGTFTLTFATAPSAITVSAADPAGNVTTADVSVVHALPLTRAVHITSVAWNYKPLHDPIMTLLKNKQINAIELDIKDEDGIIGYNSQVPFALQAKASSNNYDAKKAIAEIHAAGGRVIGRLVCFRDPAFAKWAWNNGHRDAVIQKPDSTPYFGTYGNPNKPWAFTNFANKMVRDYNNDIAVEAAKLGFDDILFDYVRRPDGSLTKMKIVGMSKVPAVDVAEFVHQTRVALGAAGLTTYLGLSVFGIAADRPNEIAQNIPMLAKYADYISPMVYPSHWGPDEYNVKNPSAQPYEIVQRSLKVFQKDLVGTHAQLAPWLQDFFHYTPAQIMAQIKAAHDDGIDSFLLWNAKAKYTSAAIRP